MLHYRYQTAALFWYRFFNVFTIYIYDDKEYEDKEYKDKQDGTDKGFDEGYQQTAESNGKECRDGVYRQRGGGNGKAAAQRGDKADDGFHERQVSVQIQFRDGLHVILPAWL